MNWLSKCTLTAALAVGLMAGAVASAAPRASGPALPADSKPLAGADLYSRTLQGVALVVAPKGQGTAWVVDRERRLLVTNFHVVAADADESADEVMLVFPEYKDGDVIAERDNYLGDLLNKTVTAKVVQADENRDLALLQAESLPDTAQALRLARKGARAGDEVASIGNPGASQALWVYNKGVVRSVYNDGGERIVETQNPLNPGDSGGPMVNAAGEVVAVNVAVSREGSLLSFGIDLSEVKAVLNDYANAPADAPKKAGKGADAHVARGDAARAAKQYDKALAEYTAALKIDPKNLDALRQRAWVRNEVGQFADAAADCTAALAVAPDDVLALRERGYGYLHLDKFARAVQDYDHLLKIDPNDAIALFHRGEAYEQLEFLAKAQADFEEALLKAPPDSRAGEERLWSGRRRCGRSGRKPTPFP